MSTKLICSKCEKDYETTGTTYQRKEGGKVDYYCSKRKGGCGCDRKPIEVAFPISNGEWKMEGDGYGQWTKGGFEDKYPGMKQELTVADPFELTGVDKAYSEQQQEADGWTQEAIDECALIPAEKRVLGIADLHAPFEHEDAYDFIEWAIRKYKINEVLQGGDLLDNHFASYHETCPDGFGAGEELDRAIDHLKRLANIAPNMKVCIGNHDRLNHRKADTGGISQRWIKTIKEVLIEGGLNAHGWEFAPSWTIDGVEFVHGDGGGNCWARAKANRSSRVQFHAHSKSYLYHYIDNEYNYFAAQVGALVDRESFAMAYAKKGPEPMLNLFVMIDGIPRMVTLREYYEDIK